MPALCESDMNLDGRASTLESGLDLYHGELMPGWYDDWVLAERERLHGLYIGGLLRLMDYQSKQDLLDAAIATGRQILRRDPLRETAHRRLIVLYMANGQPDAADRQYQICSKLLLQEIGVAPSSETQAAYARLRDAYAPT
jgi:DNA-binding SARP family transcriptional activator